MDLSLYSKYHGCLENNFTQGRAYKNNSDMIMEYTWDRDLQSCICYLYDYFHDDEPDKNENLQPYNSDLKIPIDVKFIVNSYKKYESEQVEYHIQFKPSQTCNIDYFEEEYSRRYGVTFPIGLYIDIPDSKGLYKRWLIVDKANYYETQFPSWAVLPCDYRFCWICDNKKRQMWGITRSQSSYNSGIEGSAIETVKNQKRCVLPLNYVSENLFYNQRMIISAPIKEPIAWRITKIENISPVGINKITFLQDEFDQHKDFIERDESGIVIGMYADYYANILEPETDPVLPFANAEIRYNGSKSQLKIGGSYKTFTFCYTDNIQNVLNSNVTWKFYINGNELNEDVLDIQTISVNEIKVRFIGSDDYLNTTMKIVASTDLATTELLVEIIGM